nr:immunoglobulin heavy chain junction region [Macaca mulatta]
CARWWWVQVGIGHFDYW